MEASLFLLGFILHLISSVSLMGTPVCKCGFCFYFLGTFSSSFLRKASFTTFTSVEAELQINPLALFSGLDSDSCTVSTFNLERFNSINQTDTVKVGEGTSCPRRRLQ